jgi:hypothetical protein
MMKSKLISGGVSVGLAIGLAVAGQFMFAGTSFAAGMPGAIFTTDVGCTGVNVNIFNSKDDVYVDGGPHHDGSAGLDEGTYAIKVTTPSGTILGQSTNEPITVDSTGSFVGCSKLSAVVYSVSSGLNVLGFDNTTNPGGVYKVWVCTDTTFTTCKTDNFKVKNSAQPSTGSVSGMKWEDLNADGHMDQDELGLENWTIQVYNSTHTTLIATGTTDSNGGFIIGGLPAGTYQVCEVIPANWFPSYPSITTPNCHTGVVVTGNNDTGNLNFGNYRNAEITVTKDVVAPDGQTEVSDSHSFSVTLNSITKSFAEGSDAVFSVSPGTYGAVESADSNYTLVSNDGPATVTSGGTATIHIVNEQNLSHLIVIKHVVNDNGGSAVAANFTMSVSGTNASQSSFAGAETPGVDVTLWPGTYSADETAGPSGYAKTLSSDCTGTVSAGLTQTCTITNDDIAPVLTVIKHVINDDYGTSVAGNFTMTVTGTNVLPTASFPGSESGTQRTLNAGAYNVTEGSHIGYAVSYSTDCSGSIGVGETKTCTVTNNDYHFWMTGGGSVITASPDTVNGIALSKVRVTHGFVLNCLHTLTPNNLEINWNDKTGKSHNFHLTSLTSAICSPNGNPAPPVASFNTFVGTGVGKYDGVAGAHIGFTFVDNGEPGKNDTAVYHITNAANQVVLDVSQKYLDKGNQQAHQQ